MKSIAISGTPGTGKTVLARELSLLLDYTYLDIGDFIKTHKLAEDFDKNRDCYIVNPQKVSNSLLKALKSSKKPLIFDSHMSHFLHSSYIGLCIITKCDLKTLKKRLEARGYSKEKVRENLDAEIFDTCLTEAQEAGHKIAVVDTTKKSPKTLAKEIKKTYF
ncbi:MAG: AAA family ATPase [bacterium]|nr:AAA family ATPase [bacterium]